MRIGLVCVLLAGMALAGCAESEEPDEALDDGTDPDSKDTTGNATTPDGASGPASFVLNATVENLTVALGEPFVVSLDSDLGDAAPNATWAASLSITNATDKSTVAQVNGTGLPAAFNLTSDQAGNLTLSVQAIAAGYANASALLDVVVEAFEAEPLPDPVTITGSSTFGHPAHSSICLQDGYDGDKHAVAPAEVGWRYRITSGYAVYWWNGGSYVSAGDATVNGSDAEVCDTGGLGGSYTLTMWHPDAPEPA